MHSFESFEGTPFEGVTPVKDMTRLSELVEIDFVNQQATVLDQLEALHVIVGSPYSYHRTYVDGQSLSVFVRPINDQADVFRITSNYFSIIHDTNHTHRDIWDYIISLRTGFITERNTGLEYTPGESFAIPDEVGPVIWIGDDDILQSPSGDKYRLPVPVGLFGGWGDEGERNAMLTRGTLQPEKIIKGMLNNIERYRRLIILLGKLGEDTFKPDAVIPEK